MKTFLSKYGAIAVVAFALQVVGAFIIGALTRARWQESGGIAFDSLPTPISGGIGTALGIVVFTAVGFTLRYFAYRMWDRTGVTSRGLRVGIVVFEAIYVALNLYLAWLATEPAVDSGFVWLVVIYLSAIVTGASLVVFAIALVIARRRTAARAVED